MAVATGTTLSASLAGVVMDIRTRAYKYQAQEGVCKALVTPVGVGSKGNKVTEPYWDPTSRAGTAATEGTDFTGFTTYVSTTKEYTATEWIHGTILTYNDMEDASESVRDEHARMHGIVQAKKLESKITAVFASFTPSVTATVANTGFTIAKLAVAKALLEGGTQAFGGRKSLVITPNVQNRLWTSLTNVSSVGTLGTEGDRLLKNYYAGTLLGDIDTYYTTGITTATTVTCGLFVKEAIALFVPRDFDLRTQENISLRAYELVSTVRAGARVRLASAGVKISTLGSNPS